MVDFRYRKENDVYVVWIAGVNRYIQLQEPAFEVFKLWAADVGIPAVVKACSARYALPRKESVRFVNEIITQLQQIIHPEAKERNGAMYGEYSPAEADYFVEKVYRIGNFIFRFTYRDDYLQDLFHPLFHHFEMSPETQAGFDFEIYSNNGSDFFRVNDGAPQVFPSSRVDLFQGAVFMEILSIIHAHNASEWMGVLHASAVSDGKKAVIFTAPSGSGKTTMALLMMAKGFSILSDDFVPMSMQTPEIYHFPASISVKAGAVPVLRDYFPRLPGLMHDSLPTDEFYLPPQHENMIRNQVAASAIVFVKYDATVGLELKRETNLQMMNALISQAWIAGSPEAAEKFMDWYFNLPVYSLRYSDNALACSEIGKLFG